MQTSEFVVTDRPAYGMVMVVGKWKDQGFRVQAIPYSYWGKDVCYATIGPFHYEFIYITA